MIERDEQGRIKYYRTGQGSHRHADWYCANALRSIHTGDTLPIPADQAKDWAPCERCCAADEIEAAAQAAQQQPVQAVCRNSGVRNPRRLRSTCTDCGKEGAVNRSTGTLRAHQPQA